MIGPARAALARQLAFTGTLHEVVIQLAAARAPGTDEASARAEQARQ